MKKAQNLLEYILIASMIAVVLGVGFVGKFNFRNLKNYVFMRPTGANNTIRIEPMTDISN